MTASERELIRKIAERNQEKARQLIRESRIETLWRQAGVEIRPVGSLRMGLLVKHLDIDFHLYSPTIRIADDFAVMAELAADPAVERIEYANLLATADCCLEYHAWRRDCDGDLWQIDMMHIVRGSRYDGFFEKAADRIAAALTPETRAAILELKYRTPDDEKIPGIRYYQAVLRDGVRSYEEFCDWYSRQEAGGIVEWMP